jgi:lipoprotein-anchoring transpeptidase ErfK/SrfK
MNRWVIALVVFALAGCSRPVEKAKQTASRVAEKVSDAVDEITAPMGQAVTPQERERERFDLRWRRLQSFGLRHQQQTQPAPPPQPIQFVSGVKQSFENLDAGAINSAPVNVPISGDVHGPSVLKAQVYLDRAHFSVGAIDGRWGRNSAIATWWWQRSHGLEATGEVDQQTFRSIAAAAGYVPAVIQYRLTADDVSGKFVHIPDDVYDQQRLNCLCYESLREKLAEKFHCAEDFLELLNPDVKFSDLEAGATINVPNVRPPITSDQHDIARVVISIRGNSFNAWSANGNLIYHAPTTVGSTYDPSPDETLKVIKIIDMPHFHYDPTLYSEVPDYKPDAHLKPGPNSPVGVVWMALSKAHYGIHGTKDPESIGYTSSHGCIRLTNWDAAEVEHRISEGLLVSFVDTKEAGGGQRAAGGG